MREVAKIHSIYKTIFINKQIIIIAKNHPFLEVKVKKIKYRKKIKIRLLSSISLLAINLKLEFKN
jgi:hypothetical protein